MGKYQFFAGIDMGYGDDKTVMSYFRQRKLRWWEKILCRLIKSYKIKQPLELVDTYEIVPLRKKGS